MEASSTWTASLDSATTALNEHARGTSSDATPRFAPNHSRSLSRKVSMAIGTWHAIAASLMYPSSSGSGNGSRISRS
ncbi:hypothetical protein D9M69_481990 [compost metagenome]